MLYSIDHRVKTLIICLCKPSKNSLKYFEEMLRTIKTKKVFYFRGFSSRNSSADTLYYFVLAQSLSIVHYTQQSSSHVSYLTIQQSLHFQSSTINACMHQLHLVSNWHEIYLPYIHSRYEPDIFWVKWNDMMSGKKIDECCLYESQGNKNAEKI